MSLDFSSFRKALKTLDEALELAEREPANDIVISAVIQRFEYSFELAWKMLKRQLEHEVPVPARVDTFSYRELIREGIERGLLDDFEAWITYRSQRNLSSHTYNEHNAQQVFQSARNFAPAARRLLESLENRHAA